MTKSTITREQRINEVKELIANAEEWAGYYEHPIHDKPQREMFEGMARVMAEHLAALTAMDSEAKGPISFDEWSRKCALQITLCYPDFREKAQYIWDSARETQHVAPEAMPECFRNAVSALESLYRNGQKQCWHERYTTDMAYASGVLNACRAAILAATPQLPGSEPATVPCEWIPVSERMPESNKFVLVSNGVWVGQGLYDDSEHLESDEHWQDEHREFINVLYHPVTHWMPLPAAPQEVKK